MRLSLRALTGCALAATMAGQTAANDSAGVYFRLDALLLDSTISGQDFRGVFTGAPEDVYFGGQLDGGLQGGFRIVAGAEHCSGLGVNFQYFEFDNAVPYVGEWEGGSTFLFDGDIGLDVYAFDAEVTQRCTCCCWDLVVGGGLRAGGVQIQQDGSLWSSVGSFYGVPSGSDFDGVGPTVSMGASRPLGCTGLSIVGRARASLLFGEMGQTPTFGVAPAPSLHTTNEVVSVGEIQFGMNYSHAIGAANGSFGVFWEAQRWDSDSLGRLGLHGLSLQSGLNY